jgi:TonB family protein
MSRSGVPIVLLGALLAVGSGARAEDKPAPHGLGLLAGRVTDEAARARLQSALADPRPAVRAAAVRVINVSGVGPMVPAVANALARENDPEAAVEMIRFLASLGHPQGDADAIAATLRLGEPMHKALVDGLGRQGASAARHLPALRALGLDGATWRMFYRLAVSGAGGGAGPLLEAALKEGEPREWRMVLDALRRGNIDLDPALAAAAVRSQQAGVRTGTYWHLALTFDPARPLDPRLASALDETLEARTETVDTPAALAYEVLDRRRGRPAQPSAAAVKAIGRSLREEMPWVALDSEGLLKLFDQDERKALAVLFFDDEKALDDKRVISVGPGRKEASTLSVVETPRGFPTGYVGDLLRASACDPKHWDGFLGGEVAYGPDGRPRNVSVVRRDASKECPEAARALLVSTLAPLGVPSRVGQKALLLVPDQPDFLKCLDEASNLGSPLRLDEPSSSGKATGVIREPRKIRDVKPRYPDAAREAGFQGHVVLEATLSSSGCVQGVSLIRGQRTDMDLEALRAVSGWVYEPAMLDGKPVPVLMTVAVNFTVTR